MLQFKFYNFSPLANFFTTFPSQQSHVAQFYSSLWKATLQTTLKGKSNKRWGERDRNYNCRMSWKASSLHKNWKW